MTRDENRRQIPEATGGQEDIFQAFGHIPELEVDPEGNRSLSRLIYKDPTYLVFHGTFAENQSALPSQNPDIITEYLLLNGHRLRRQRKFRTERSGERVPESVDIEYLHNGQRLTYMIAPHMRNPFLAKLDFVEHDINYLTLCFDQNPGSVDMSLLTIDKLNALPNDKPPREKIIYTALHEASIHFDTGNLSRRNMRMNYISDFTESGFILSDIPIASGVPFYPPFATGEQYEFLLLYNESQGTYEVQRTQLDKTKNPEVWRFSFPARCQLETLFTLATGDNWDRMIQNFPIWFSTIAPPEGTGSETNKPFTKGTEISKPFL